MKDKRQKSSIYHHSIKTKARKQDFEPILTEKSPFFSIPGAKSLVETTDGHFRFTRDGHGGAAFYLGGDDESVRPDYKYDKGPEEQTYRFEFTNSQFIYFLGNLTPKQYLLFVNLIALLITEDLNNIERRIVYAFISNIADSIQTIFEQGVILEAYRQTRAIRDLNNALHVDLKNLYDEVQKLKSKLP